MIIPAARAYPRLDQVAIAMSTMCAIHCLIGPILIVIAPALLATLGVSDAVFHRLLLALVLPASATALVLGCRRHKDRVVVTLGVLGLGALCAAALAGHDALGELGERLVTLAGAITLAAGHVRNFRLCRRDACGA